MIIETLSLLRTTRKKVILVFFETIQGLSFQFIRFSQRRFLRCTASVIFNHSMMIDLFNAIVSDSGVCFVEGSANQRGTITRQWKETPVAV